MKMKKVIGPSGILWPSCRPDRSLNPFGLPQLPALYSLSSYTLAISATETVQ